MQKETYSVGDRILLIHMDDPRPVPDGTRGTVSHIDDANQIHMNWDNGSRLAIIQGIDDFHKLTPEELAAERR